ncbi:hypothetical protein [Microbacterium sp. EF45047]|uniref:hypothetical protein n=1 Tax=Microbacterium sp. EF45047 TaxID=2809708 RepID=UPI00234AEEE8|nr:hypothetical protein [Microbacterium sp. EF45047]WCM56485.1 hypothetical protein JRG78_04650 [Microbacterium sp. EF45047]
MRTAYRVLAYLVCALVAVQAASHAWASAGLAAYIFGGGTIDPSAAAPPPVPEFLGLMIHGMNGMYVIPLVSIVLLILSFFVKAPKAVAFAVAIVLLVGLQVTLGILGHGLTFLALLHGLNALVLFGTALTAGTVVGRRPLVERAAAEPVSATV